MRVYTGVCAVCVLCVCYVCAVPILRPHAVHWCGGIETVCARALIRELPLHIAHKHTRAQGHKHTRAQAYKRT